MAIRPAERFGRHPVVLGALFFVYIVSGKLGLMLALVNPSATAVWAPAGITLAAFIILGYRIWPVILGAAFVVNITTSGSVLTSLAIAAGNTVEGVIGAYLIHRFAGGGEAFKSADRIFRFAAIAAICATPISATCGVTSLAISGSARWMDFGYIWMTWWLGNLTGDLVIVPFVVLWCTTQEARPHWTKILESAGLLVFLGAVAMVVFGGLYPSDIKTYPLEFLCAPFFVWAAFRIGRREVASSVLLLSIIAVWGTLHRYGPFVRETPDESLLLLQAYTSVTAVMFVALGAVVAEHRQAQAQLQMLSVTDPLTGLSNYRRMLEVLRAEIARSDRTTRPFALLFMDLDGLKRINDKYGHLAGSRALCRVAMVLRTSCRVTDTPARFGGDEFALILTETDEAGALEVAHRVTERLAADPERPLVSVSTGIAVYPRDGGTPAKLLSTADTRLYDRKQSISA